MTFVLGMKCYLGFIQVHGRRGCKRLAAGAVNHHVDVDTGYVAGIQGTKSGGACCQ